MKLYKVADTTKKILIGIVAILAILLVVRIVVSIVENLSRTLITDFSVATRGFGELPDLTLKQMDGSDSHSPSFSIETLSGKLPDISNLFVVYRIVQPNRTLSSETFAQNAAEQLEFSAFPDKLSAVEWEWAEGSKKLTFNIQSQHFKYTNLAPDISEEENELDYPDKVLSPLIEQLGYDIPDKAAFRFDYVDEVDGKYIPTLNFQAQYVRVSMVTTLVNTGNVDAEVVSALYQPSPVYVIILNQSKAGFAQVREMSYSLWSADTENSQTYYGLTVHDAYNRLSAGGGALTSAVYLKHSGIPEPSSISTVRVTDVQIGYYSPSAYVTYLQPVYVFYCASGEGDNRVDLTYYVPAL